MKTGDLVRCLYQPKSSGYDSINGCMIPMPYTIKGELGFYVKHRDSRSGTVLFPRFGYEHTIAWSALQVICESR